MSADAVESPARQKRYWRAVLVGVIALQVALVFWLGDATRIIPRRAPNESRFILAPDLDSEIAELCDPALFAWASPHGFSAPAWLRTPAINYESADWTEQPRFLRLHPDQLGEIVRQLAKSKISVAPQFAAKPEPRMALPDLSAFAPPMPDRSELRVGGDLVGRKLLSRFRLPSQTNADLLAASVVQLMVNAAGWAESAALVSSSGSAVADKLALELARSARFEPLRGGGPYRDARVAPELTWGTLTFSWLTVPPRPPATNAAPVASPGA
jgi:TonB family protein